MYVYLQSESNPDLFTVGFYTPDNSWEPDSDHPTREEAQHQVAILNGEKITKKHLPDLVTAYKHEDGSDGTAPYRDITTDLMHLAIKELGISSDNAVTYISMSAEEVFRKEDAQKKKALS